MRASSFLGERGVEEHAVSAELLLQHVLGVTRARLLAMWSDPMDEDAFDALWALLQRRAAGEPVQYIIGETYFYGLPFRVTKAVLIPRPETELLVERVLHMGRERWGKDEEGPLVVDVGTGSGAIAVSLAAEQPAWRVAAIDISPEALEVARENAAANGVAERVAFLEGDLLDPAIGEYGASIDMLVSNPPYIRSWDIDGLQREVRDYEPHLALDGGADGLNPYRRMLQQMAAASVWPRIVAFECGLGQAQELAGLLRETGQWTNVSIVEDYAGIERHVIGARR
jgi:release factor glutamine methyltransferase